MNLKEGDKVRLIRTSENCIVPKEHRTKEFEVAFTFSSSIFIYIKKEGLISATLKKNLVPANAVIHTKTQDEFNQLMKELEKVGYRWLLGEKPTEFDGYTNYGDQTCISFEDDYLFCHFKKFFLNHNHPIIPFTDIFGSVPSEINHHFNISDDKIIEDFERRFPNTDSEIKSYTEYCVVREWLREALQVQASRYKPVVEALELYLQAGHKDARREASIVAKKALSDLNNK